MLELNRRVAILPVKLLGVATLRPHKSVTTEHRLYRHGLMGAKRVVCTLRPSELSVVLMAAILYALPWSLAHLLVDVSQGFTERAALIVTAGLFANAA